MTGTDEPSGPRQTRHRHHLAPSLPDTTYFFRSK